MNFFGMGPAELIVIMVIALIVFGPGKLTEIGGSLGRGVREFRRATSELTDEFQQSMRSASEVTPNEVRREPLDQLPPMEAERSYGVNNRTCPSCAAPNPTETKFCGQCGAGLIAAETQEGQAT